MSRSYLELMTLSTYEERLLYLKLNAFVGQTTFANHRYLNQLFYQSEIWKACRRKILIRDLGNDLACQDRPISTFAIVHHIEPITINDILHNTDKLLSPNNLISCSSYTHEAIHYNREIISQIPDHRTPNDTCPWL